MNLTLVALLTTYLTLMAFGMACSVQDTEPQSNVASPTNNHSIPLEIGNDVGDMTPDFNILITNGETLSYSDLRSNETPIFLFFFSRF